MTGLTGTSPTGMWVWQLFLFMKVVGVSSHSFVCEWGRTDASCEVCVTIWAVYFLGFGEGTWGLVPVEWPHYQGYLFFFFFGLFGFFFSFSGSSVSVNVKKTNKELCKLTFLFPGCFAVWEILENLEGGGKTTPVFLYQKGDERHLVDIYWP